MTTTMTTKPTIADPSALRFRFSIDRGGTFTDVYCEIWLNDTKFLYSRVGKLLSEDPSNYPDAPTEGIRRLLESETGIPHPRHVPLPTHQIHSIRMGTTVATNALLERKGERTALLTTRGFADLQVIGNQSRPKIFDLEIRRPELLFDIVMEIEERVILLPDVPTDTTTSSEIQQETMDIRNSIVKDPTKVHLGITHESIYVETPLNEKDSLAKLSYLRACGYNSLAIVLVHSYTYPQHEQKLKELAQKVGFDQISCSSEVMPMIRMIPRGGTTCVDAYLTPVIKTYLKSFSRGFQNELKDVNVSFMQSDGGLTPMDCFCGNKAILSGPAGGVVGYAVTSEQSVHEKTPFSVLDESSASSNIAVIGFDMGGTSTDVSRYAGVYEHVFETTTAGVTIQSPQLDINTVAAGGGSRLFFKNGLFVVGPESAGAHPGPVCYRKNGYLAITDANVMLGRIQPHLFPSIFGESEKESLDFEATKLAFEALTIDINNQSGPDSQYTVDEVAYGFIRVATEAMARPIRNLTTMKGYDVTKHWLACFGGAGPQHCCAIAKSLGMKKILVHRHSGILSAYGLSLADVVVEKQEPFSCGELKSTFELAKSRLEILKKQAVDELLGQGFQQSAITVTCFLNCRYHGTDTSMMTSPAADSCVKELLVEHFEDVFISNYRREFGFELQGRSILVDDVRVRATGHTNTLLSSAHRKIVELESSELENLQKQDGSIPEGLAPPPPRETVQVFFETSRYDTPVYEVTDLPERTLLTGPALLIQDVATVVIEPHCTAYITSKGDIEILVDDFSINTSEQPKRSSLTIEEAQKGSDPVYLSIFSHRFMSIAEQMGRTLQRTSISVNIKERLDFSCALFDRKGGLVANAPHLPVHLGAMSEAVRYQIKFWGDDLSPGDVLVSNHPQLAGGSHLPDITVITPIFWQGKLEFFVASRGHHADVGGIAPGSMPPLSKRLVEEGAAIIAFKLVKQGGAFDEAGITELLLAPGKNPAVKGGNSGLKNSGARNISDNLNDLKAQIAANQRGALLMNELIQEYSLEIVQAYMGHIQSCAEESVRTMLVEFSLREGMDEVGHVHAKDFMDDGTPITLSIEINRKTRSAIFDFEGTGPEMYGNLNAPPAVTASAVIYCLRCLLPESEIPLNQGCLTPIEIRIPTGTILNPSSEAAVVGGNVTTSQRVTDVVLLAFKASAASQGCMNNLTFGNSRMGYYETIAGGAGAGPTWNGTSGVHTHMTNTRITDVEILERRYPVIVRMFGLRRGSGGDGYYKGGDGVIRKLEFTTPLTVSILSERRAFAPYGLLGGAEGARGLNLLTFTADNRTINLGGKNTIEVNAGDVLTIHTPGGGGFGKVLTEEQKQLMAEGKCPVAHGGAAPAGKCPVAHGGAAPAGKCPVAHGDNKHAINFNYDPSEFLDDNEPGSCPMFMPGYAPKDLVVPPHCPASGEELSLTGGSLSQYTMNQESV